MYPKFRAVTEKGRYFGNWLCIMLKTWPFAWQWKVFVFLEDAVSLPVSYHYSALWNRTQLALLHLWTHFGTAYDFILKVMNLVMGLKTCGPRGEFYWAQQQWERYKKVGLRAIHSRTLVCPHLWNRFFVDNWLHWMNLGRRWTQICCWPLDLGMVLLHANWITWPFLY